MKETPSKFPRKLAAASGVAFAVAIGGAAVALGGGDDRQDPAPAKAAKVLASSPTDTASSVSGATRTLRGGNATRGLTVTIPATIRTFERFVATWEGNTGRVPAGPFGGGFIVSTYLLDRARACPSSEEAHEQLDGRATEIGSSNIFVAGPYRGASQPVVTTAGAQRVCGYLTTGDSREQAAELMLDEVISVGDRVGGGISDEITPVGEYVAEAEDISGGTAASHITLALEGDPESPVVKRVRVRALRLTTCPTTEDNPLRGTTINADLSIQKEGLDNRLIGSSVSVYFATKARFGDASVFGGSDGHGELRGVVVLSSDDGFCSGSFAFTAKLKGV